MPRKTKVNPEEHLGILHHVVDSATLAIPQYLKDEALSEGYVLLVHAASTYDPKHKVPAGYWIAKKLRWGLLNWKILETRKHGKDDHTLMVERSSNQLEENPRIIGLAQDKIAAHELRLELERLVEIAAEILDDSEYAAIFGPAFGLHMKELSHLLGANPNQITELQRRGRERINEMRML